MVLCVCVCVFNFTYEGGPVENYVTEMFKISVNFFVALRIIF